MKQRHHCCTVLRTFERKHYEGFAAVEAGTPSKVETVTERCGVPLFSGDDCEAGVCRTCAKGWEVEGNKFASPSDKARAVQVGQEFYGKKLATR